MTTFPGSPRLIKGGIVLVDPASGRVLRVISLQYNPDTLTRSLQVKGVAAEGGDRSEALRLKGPPVETYKLEAELDATDALAAGEPGAVARGLHAELAVLELLVYPSTAQLRQLDTQASAGVLEVAPMESPLTLFIWSQHRIVPVRITELSVTEEAFDPQLNPIRAKVSLGLRVLSVDDLGFRHKGGSLFMVYQGQKEQLAALGQPGSLSTLGIAGAL
jgi:hypothetical protein